MDKLQTIARLEGQVFDHKASVRCGLFFVAGLSLFHMGFEMAGWGLMVFAFSTQLGVWAASYRRHKG